jgi:plastocyanin
MAPRLLLLVVLAFGAVTLGACGGGGKSSTPPCPPKADTRAAANGAVTVCAVGTIAYDVKNITTTAGTLTVTFINKSSIQHTFTVENTPLNLEASSGSSKTGSVQLQKGSYTFKCTVSGHEAAGMKGTIEVL